MDRLALPLRVRWGQVVTVRRMRPQDAERLQSYIRGLSRESRRNRFLGALNELSPAELAKLGGLDLRDQGVLIVETRCAGECTIVAEARYAMAHEKSTCEVALSVNDRWQRQGLGTWLMGILEARARDLGARVVTADALRTNDAVKALARKAAFSIKPEIGDPRLMQLVKPIAPRAAAIDRPHAAA
jgi:GNAT superfamily N-acetyltransferase